MITPRDKRIVLERTDREFENQAVLNPATYQIGDVVHMWYRAVHEGNYSSIGYAQFKGDECIYRADQPILAPRHAYERHGLEDPRIVFIDGKFHMFYTVYDGSDVQVAYATSRELPRFRKHRIISPAISFHELRTRCEILDTAAPEAFFCLTHLGTDSPNDHTLLWEKDTFLFPRRINGKLALIHRIKPDIQLIYCDELSELGKPYWLKHLDTLEGSVVLSQKYNFENAYIGGGAPPIETNDGWLLIYHAVDSSRTYRAGAALLDLNRPEKVTHRLPYPLFSPEEEWEKVGDVNNVVFPTGTTVNDDRLDVYYGAADKRIARVTFSMKELLTELTRHPVNH